MTDDDDIRHEPLGLPGSEIVKGFGDEVRKAFDEAVQDIEGRIDAAAKNAEDERRFRRALRAAGLLVGAGLMAAGVVWLMVGRGATEWSVRHADGLIETCSLAPDAPDDKPAFVCHLSEQPAPGTAR